MQHSIKIPDFILEKLKRSTYNKLVEEVLTNYSEWIARNETIFFREYTDHGVDHLESVLETSVSLLTEKSKIIFSDSDACLLVISTILHDVALHIQENQFIRLVEKDSFCDIIKEIDTETWHSLWIKYSAEASRFSQSQLQLFFGVTENIPIPDLKSPLTWTPLQYQLIGEFLRRHHPRLAHDFAVFGFPAVENDKNIFIKTDSPEFKKFIDLAGLVARSHGTSLRSLFEYLKSTFGHLRAQEGSHAIYIMCILRIADFLQLQPSRAPKGQMIVKNLKSPLSRREWGIHAAIQSIVYKQHEDPESVEVIIDPSKINIELFLRIQNLLSLLQTELDYSWAVLGEVFGRFDESVLGLTIRRVRSNIDDKNKFSKKAGFVTEKATFTAADAELLKLFIKPLYGDKPEIAVRELVQNSVDAVRERIIFEPENLELENSPSVIVSIQKSGDGRWILRIEDKGIGMSLNTIINYFLNAGASFRLSTVWKEKFLDEKGKAKVLRAGRFGVGALAAFMLAEDPTQIEMKVITRHISSPIDGAFEFTTKLSDTPIQIKYVEKKEAGTIIEILTANPPAFMQESTKETSAITWDWYCLDKPIVERFSLNGKRLQQSVILPSTLETSKFDYHWINPKDYDSIGWTYSDLPAVVCNGIIVISNKMNNKYSLEEGKFINRDIKINMPSISIFDKDGKLPITLDRLRIEYDQLQFLGEIREDIEKNILAFLLVSSPTQAITDKGVYNAPILKTYPALKDYLPNIPWMISSTGTILYCTELIHIAKVKNILEIQDSSLLKILISELEPKFTNVGFAIETYSIWDDIQTKPLKIMGGSRVKIERQRIHQRKLYEILDLLDRPKTKSNYKSIPENKINSYLEQKFKYVNSDSPYDIMDLLRREIYNMADQNLLEDNFSNYSDHFYDIERKLDNKEISIIDLKKILYDIGNRKTKLTNHDIRLIFSNIAQKYDERRNRHDIEELVYRIERELENLYDRNNENQNEDFHRIRDEIRYKLNRRHHSEFNYANLDLILSEIRNINDTPPVVEIEAFGEIKRVLNWEKMKSLDYNRNTNSVPVAEIVLDINIKFKSTNNFLAKIWLEYIGDNEIPFDDELRQDFILKIQNKFNIERHITHWKNVLNESLQNKKNM
jgi:molecular chaperone HtpG